MVATFWWRGGDVHGSAIVSCDRSLRRGYTIALCMTAFGVEVSCMVALQMRAWWYPLYGDICIVQEGMMA